MATPFFGTNKRESDTAPGARTVPSYQPGGSSASSSTHGAGSASASTPAASNSSTPAADSGSSKEGGSKLIVGPNIKLKGVEITDCDTLVVEGLVEATMDSRLMQIAEIGAFKGSAEIDVAEIRGSFDGDLTVRDKLVIYATGKVTGKIRYGKVVIEEGGQLSGDITFGTSEKAKSATSSKPALQMAA